MTASPDAALRPLTDYLTRARWFGGKGLAYAVTDVRRLATLPGPPLVTVDLVEVSYDGGLAETYQLPLVHHAEEREDLRDVLVEGVDSDRGWAYDAVHDETAMAVYLHWFDEASLGEAAADGVTFRRLPGHDLDTGAHPVLFRGEQSNSSIAFGQDCLLKLFRKVTPGRNPDIEIHQALTLAGAESVGRLYGWVEAGTDDGPMDLGMLQEFLRDAHDGWALALGSVRNALADDEGADFADAAERLGAAVAQVHAVLRDRFPMFTWETDDLGALAQAMLSRLDRQRAEVPDLEAAAAGAAALFARVAGLGEPVVAQRVHGDLHLGQTLRTADGWKIVDFEGEPAKPLAERVLPDSPWRDVAGMLRSFDYAARSVEREVADHTDEVAQTLDTWVVRNRAAFLTGYVGDRDLTDAERVLVEAYEADKAVYEVGYEARNRPSWTDIPLAALARLNHPSGETGTP